MDQPGLNEARHRAALADLARINRLSRVAQSFLPALAGLAGRLGRRRLTVLDVACGGGDVTLTLWRAARRRQLGLEIEACDKSPVALAVARGRASAEAAPVQFFEHDLLEADFPGRYDAVLCSLLLHHLDERQAVVLLGRMAAAADHLVLVNDLVRSRAGHWLALAVTRLLTRSDVVRADGPQSVAAAWRPEEALRLAERAGLSGAVVRRCWPLRYLLAWESAG